MNELLSPYVGLVPYSEKDEPFFFGRSKERRSVAFNLRGARLTVMYGPSGVGKSSLLNAGVAHDLHELAERNHLIYKCPELIVVVFNVWRDDPISTLNAEITNAARKFTRHEEVQITPRTLAKTVEAWSERLHSDILIIFDQFEDYFVNVKPAAAAAFAQEFSETLNNPTLRANFLISIREDALSQLDVFKSTIPSLFENYLRIDYLRAKAAREVIREPISVYNRQTRAVPQYIVEPRLVEEVIGDILLERRAQDDSAADDDREKSASEGDGAIAAPLLQLVMRTIWDTEIKQNSYKLRLSTLEQLGNTIEIVTNHLKAQVDALPEHEKELASLIFTYLVTPSGWTIAHTVQDLSGYTKQKPEVLEPVLSTLTESRILRQVPGPFHANVARFEIFHQVLIAGVLGWLSQYNIAKETKIERARLREDLIHMEKQEKKARRRMRNAFIGLIVVVLIAVGFLLLAIYANELTKKARAAEEKAQTIQSKLEQQILNIDNLERQLPFSHALLRGHKNSVTKAIFTPDGRMIVTISDDGEARAWKTDGGELLLVRSLPSSSDVDVNSSGLVAVANSSQITLWDLATNTTTLLGRNTGRITRLSFDPKDGRFLASADDNGNAIVWDVVDKRALHALSGHHKGPISDIEWSPVGTMVATAGADYTANVWNGKTGILQTSVRHDGSINTAVFSQDGKELLTASDDLTARIWNAMNGTVIRVLTDHRGPVNSAKFSPDRIVTASDDGTARLWDARTRKLIRILPSYSDKVRGASFSSNGTQIITWGADLRSRVWDVVTGKFVSLGGHMSATNFATFSPNSKLVVTASADHTARVWNVGTELKIREVKLSVEQASYDSCPAIVRVIGRIEVEGGSGIVKYRLVGRGVPQGPERSLVFDGPGGKDIGAFYRFAGPSQVNGSVYLWITSPEDHKSKTVYFRVDCTSSTPPGEGTERHQPTP